MDFFIDNTPLDENQSIETQIITEKKDKHSIPVLDKLIKCALVAKQNETHSKPMEEQKFTKPIENKVDSVCSDISLVNKDGKKETVKLSEVVNIMKKDSEHIDKLMEKSVIRPGFEKLRRVPRYDVNDKKLQKERQKQRKKTKGKSWFDLPATEKTPEVIRDLQVLQMRSVLDPKHFYKKNDLKVLPKYFQIGKVIDSPLDYYNNRFTKKERKRTLVDELLADAEFNKYNKKKYAEIIEQRKQTHYKEHMKAKRLKRKKKK